MSGPAFGRALRVAVGVRGSLRRVLGWDGHWMPLTDIENLQGRKRLRQACTNKGHALCGAVNDARLCYAGL